MRKPPSRFLLALLALLFISTLAAAQQPTPEQAKALLAAPGGADSIRALIRASGLTSEQIRSRLQAAGYDPALVDPFLTTGPTPDTLSVSADQRAALAALGIRPDATPPQPVVTGLRVVDSLPAIGVFGVDVFRRSTTQFLPLLSGPVPPEYRLGPGDVLVPILTGDVELTYQLGVTREGFVVIPQVGQVYLANLTLAQARNTLTDRLGRVYSGVRRGPNATTHFDLAVANVRAVQVYVVGEVTQPGAYQMSALGTVLTALYAAGGVTERANPRTVEVQRAGQAVATFDLYDYLLRGNTRNDIRIENGDVVFVGVRARRVTVVGNVNRPARYDLAQGETLTDLIAAAGGLDAAAARTRLSIARIVPPTERRPDGPQRVTLDVPLPSGSTVIPPVPLADGDSITAFEVPGAERNYVTVEGNVYHPGRYGLENQLTLSRLVELAGGFRPATYAGRALISRLNAEDQTRRLIAVSLPPDSTAPWTDDPALQDRDSVVIFGLLDTRPPLTTVIVGAVNDPGRRPWEAGMTLRDLILMSGGLAPGASLAYAEIARLPVQRTGGELATTIRVPLDSTYLFDRDSSGQYIGPPGLPFPASGAPEVPLEPWDNVLIFRQPEFEFQQTVTIGGEVTYPGTYALIDKAERLSELISRAGGLSASAYPEGIRFVRDSGDVGRLNVDLPMALKKPGSRSDIALRGGDQIWIPRYQPSVRIDGAVISPGSVLWERGKSLSDYIDAAGGPQPDGDEGRAVVRQPNGQVETKRGGFLFFGGSSPRPAPGAMVLVPIKEKKPSRDNTGTWLAVASIIASTATIVIALNNQ